MNKYKFNDIILVDPIIENVYYDTTPGFNIVKADLNTNGNIKLDQLFGVYEVTEDTTELDMINFVTITLELFKI